MATATFQITFSFDAATQPLADAKRDAALVDFAKSKGLNIYQSDGVTIDPTKVGPAVRNLIRERVRDDVIEFRVSSGVAALRTTEQGNLGNP